MNEHAWGRVLVAGASGFIGRWAARRLAEAGASVSAVVRDRESVETVLGRFAPTAVPVLADLAAEGEATRIVEKVRPDAVFNFVAYGVDRAEQEPALAERLNAQLPERLLRAVVATGRNVRFVHVGSALEYGAIGGDLAEDSEPHPTTLYGRTKLRGTLGVSRLAAETGARAVTARLFTVFGAGEHEGRLLPTLLAAGGRDGPIALSEGRQRRDFIWVADAVDALLSLALAPSAPGEIVNVATGTLTSVRAFVERAAAVIGISPSRLHFGAIPTRAEEMEHEPVSVARFRRLVGEPPPSRIEHGVRETIALSDEGGP